jgi:hypothetical protein
LIFPSNISRRHPYLAQLPSPDGLVTATIDEPRAVLARH